MRLLSDEDCQREVDPLLLAIFRTVDLDKYPHLTERATEQRGFIVESWEAPFTDAVSQRGVFHSLPQLSPEQCRAVSEAARSAGDSGLYLYNPVEFRRLDPADIGEYMSALRAEADAGTPDAFRAVLRRFTDWTEVVPWWPARYFALGGDDEADAFVKWYEGAYSDLFPSHILLSASGRWGMYVTDANHTLLGATAAAPRFIENYCAELGTTPQAIAEQYATGYEVSEWQRARRFGKQSAYSAAPALLAHVYGPTEAERLLIDPAAMEDAGTEAATTAASQAQHTAGCRYCRLVMDTAAPGRVYENEYGVMAVDPRDVQPRRVLLLPRRHALLTRANLKDVSDVPAGSLALGYAAADILSEMSGLLYHAIKAAFPSLQPSLYKWDGENSQMRDTHAHYYSMLCQAGEDPLTLVLGSYMVEHDQPGPEMPAAEQREIAERLRAAMAAAMRGPTA